MANAKTYEYKIFDSGGNYITSLANVISDYAYQQNINTAGNAISIEVGTTADDNRQYFNGFLVDEAGNYVIDESGNNIQVVGELPYGGVGGAISINNSIEVWVYYGYDSFLVDENSNMVVDQTGNDIVVSIGSPQGLCKFKGFISSFSARYGDNETVIVNCLPYSTDLDNYVIKSGLLTNASYYSTDPSVIAKSILDNFVSQGGSTTYNSSSVDLTSTVVTYTFKLNTILEGLKKVQEFAPSDWWWFVDPGTNLYNLHHVPDNPAHTFIIGKHIKNLDLAYNMEQVVNTYYFLGGNVSGDVNSPDYLFKEYTDSTSQTLYRQKLARDTDGRVTDQDSADILGASKINTMKNPRYVGTVTVLSAQYDIETISLGEKVGFNGFGNYIDDLQLQITGLSYTPDYVTLSLDTILSQPSKRLEDIKRNLLQTDTQNIPDSPT